MHIQGEHFSLYTLLESCPNHSLCDNCYAEITSPRFPRMRLKMPENSQRKTLKTQGSLRRRIDVLVENFLVSPQKTLANDH